MKRFLACVLAIAALPCPVVPGADSETLVVEDRKYQRAFDEAVDRGLTYLAKSQAVNGSFGGGTPALTSLAVMAFLAHGYGPGLEPHGDVIDRGIDFILSVATPDGVLMGNGGQMYSHSISTLMLSEVSGMVAPERQSRIDEVLPKAVQVLLAAQSVPKGALLEGGWRYAPNSADSDISHSGWAMMALRSARNNGAPVPKEAIDRAARYILNSRCSDGGFSYNGGGGGGSNLSRAGIGLLCLELSGRHRDEVTLKAGELITKGFGNFGGELTVFYALYYCASGMYQLGGDEWEKFAPRLYDTILKMQGADGSWVGGGSSDNNPAYGTSMAVLALSVSYRQLPIYQR